MFLENAGKHKLTEEWQKIQKHCILRCFFPFRCENFCFEKRSKHRNLQCFLLPPKTKQHYLRCFLLSQPQNRAETSVFAMFLQHQKKQRSQNTAICVTFTTPHLQNAVFYSVLLNHLFKNTGIYGVLKNYLHKTI